MDTPVHSVSAEAIIVIEIITVTFNKAGYDIMLHSSFPWCFASGDWITFIIQGLSLSPLNFVIIVSFLFYFFSEIKASYHSVADRFLPLCTFQYCTDMKWRNKEFFRACSVFSWRWRDCVSLFSCCFDSGWCWIAWNSKWHGNESGIALYNYRLFWNKCKNTEQCVAEFFALQFCGLALWLSELG